MRKRIVFLITVVLLLSVKVFPQNQADDIIGIWLTGGKEPAKIQIYKSGDQFHGKIIWLRKPTDKGKERVDANNPDQSKRNKAIIGMVILTGVKFDGVDEWKGGVIYDPESGRTYNCFIYLKDKNTVRVRGYVGIALFGRTETWIRSN